MRYILIRRISLLEDDRVIAHTTFSSDEEYLQDHFPGSPIVPGALLVEAMAQAGGWLILCRLDFAAWPLMTMIEGAKFRNIVRPGDELTLTATLEASARQDFRVKVEAETGECRVVDARFFYHAFEPGEVAWLPDGLDVWSRAILERLQDDNSSSRLA